MSSAWAAISIPGMQKPALHCTVVEEGLLQRIELIGAEAFDRHDLGLVRLDSKHQAGVDNAAV